MDALLLGLLRMFCHVAALRNSSWPRPIRGLLSAPDAGGVGGSRLLDVDRGGVRPLPMRGGDGKPMEVGTGGPSPAAGMPVPLAVGDLGEAVERSEARGMVDCCSTDLLFPPARAMALREPDSAKHCGCLQRHRQMYRASLLHLPESSCMHGDQAVGMHACRGKTSSPSTSGAVAKTPASVACEDSSRRIEGIETCQSGGSAKDEFLWRLEAYMLKVLDMHHCIGTHKSAEAHLAIYFLVLDPTRHAICKDS